MYLRLPSVCLHDKSAIYTLPLEVPGYVDSVQNDFDKFPVGHDELGYQVDVPVSVVAEVWRYLLSGPELLEQIRQVDACSFSSVVRIPVYVKDFFPMSGEQASKDGFSEASA